jgi:uncharacterized protein YoxC
MDPDLLAYLNQQFSSIEERFLETGKQIQSLREEFQDFRKETVQRFERVDDDVRGVHIVLEDLQGTVRLVAEGVTGVREELKQNTEELSRKIDETASFNRKSYEDLNVRVRTLEAAKRVRPAKGGPRRG